MHKKEIEPLLNIFNNILDGLDVNNNDRVLACAEGKKQAMTESIEMNFAFLPTESTNWLMYNTLS